MEKIEEVEKDMTPKLIGEVYKKFPTIKSNQLATYGLYECQYCKNTFEAIFNNVKSGNTKSCGCFATKLSITHGLESNKFYQTWYGMLQRCTNLEHRSYKNYGARGIAVCEEWQDVTNFVAWAESTHPNMEGYTLDRINNDKGYFPENCRWTDKSTQSSNQRVLRKSNTSGYKGVLVLSDKRHLAYIRFKNTKFNLGVYLTKLEAAKAYDSFVILLKWPHSLNLVLSEDEIVLPKNKKSLTYLQAQRHSTEQSVV